MSLLQRLIDYSSIPHIDNSFSEIIFSYVIPYILFISLRWYPLVYSMELGVNFGAVSSS